MVHAGIDDISEAEYNKTMAKKKKQKSKKAKKKSNSKKKRQTLSFFDLYLAPKNVYYYRYEI